MAKFNLKDLLESQVIDPIVAVMVQKDKAIMDKVAALGTWVGTSTTLASMPTVDLAGKAISAGDMATLSAKDGDNVTGLYRYDGTTWLLEIDYSDINMDNIAASLAAGALTTTVDADGVVSTTAAKKFVNADDLAVLLNSIKAKNDELYHPKGGDPLLKVVGADAEENTQEFTTAKQMSATFTTAEVLAKYEAL